MLSQLSSATNQTSQGREERRRQILDALRGEADAILERMADELVDLPEDKAFGQIEYTLRDLGHDLASRAHQAGLDAGKKVGYRKVKGMPHNER
jgi:hypothetical protein